MVEQDLTTDDVAAALRLNKITVQRMLKRGSLRGYQIGRSWRIPPRALEEFRAGAANTAPQPTHFSDVNITAIKPITNRKEWLEVLYDHSALVDAPPLLLEATRRENLYSDRY